MSSWIIHLVFSHGPWGVGALMFLENIIVFIPSELIMPLAGFAASRGRVPFWGAVVAGTIGTNLGSLCWYMAGRLIPHDRFTGFVRRHGVWLALEPKNLKQAEDWFERHGAVAVLTGRLIPALRTFIAIPAGFSKMPLLRFIPFSLAGTFVFNLALAFGGRELGSHFRSLQHWIRPIAWIVIGGLFVVYVYRVVRLKTARQ